MLIAWVSVWMVSCKPEDFSLGAADVKPEDLVEGIAFKIEHDTENPNIVYLTSLMDSRYTPLWDHPQGRSQDHRVTLKIPFEGTYEVKFGVQTRAGIVFGAPATFTITDFYAGFVDHELWTFLTGGVGNSKTWIHDNGQYGLAPGELSYADPSTTVEWGNFSPNWEPGGGHTDETGLLWGSEMTFSLIGGAQVAVATATAEGVLEENGTFMLNVDNHTLTMVDARLMHPPGWSNKTTNWSRDLKILALDENQLRVAVLREEAVAGEADWWLIWNFVSKEYAENYVGVEPEPPYNGNANEDLTTSITTSKKWKLSSNTPYNWTNLAGEMLNPWSSPADYMATGWAPYDEALIKNISLTMTKTGEVTGSYIFTDGGGNKIEGSYITDDKANIIFDKSISFAVSGWVSLETTSENMLRIIKVEQDVTGALSGLWLGKRDPNKQEYQVYKFEPAGSGGSTDPLAPWKTALVGKTFVPDVQHFADWVDGSWVGGWTKSIFPNNFTEQAWFWNQDVYNAAIASSITFYLDGDQIKANAVDIGVSKNGISVEVDPENRTITYSEAPFTFSFVFTDNGGGKGPWMYGAYDGANLNNVNTKGIYLGFVSKENEITMHHLVRKQ